MFWLAIRQLGRRPLRTGLTAAGIVIATAGLVSLTTIVGSLQDSWTGGLNRAGGDVFVYEHGAIDPLNGSVPADLRPQIEAVDGVAAVHPMVMRLAAFQPGDAQSLLIGREIPSPLWAPLALVDGTLPDPEVRWQAVLGSAIAGKAGVGVGDRVNLLFQDFDVVGVADTGTLLGDHGVHIGIDDATDLLFLENAASFFLVASTPAADAEIVAERIMAAVAGVTAGPNDDVIAENQVMSLLQTLSWSVSLVALVTGIALVTTTMMMSVAERRRDLALYKCLGWSNARIFALVVSESVAIGILSGAVGVALGFAAALGVGLLDMVATFISPRPTPGIAIIGIAAATATSLFGAVLPALNAVSIRPATVLGHQRI